MLSVIRGGRACAIRDSASSRPRGGGGRTEATVAPPQIQHGTTTKPRRLVGCFSGRSKQGEDRVRQRGDCLLHNTGAVWSQRRRNWRPGSSLVWAPTTGREQWMNTSWNRSTSISSKGKARAPCMQTLMGEGTCSPFTVAANPRRWGGMCESRRQANLARADYSFRSSHDAREPGSCPHVSWRCRCHVLL